MALSFVRFVVHFAIRDQIPLEMQMSPSIRHLFGRAMKDTYCVQRMLSCSLCPMSNCLYRTVFDDTSSQNKPYIIYHSGTNGNIVEIQFTFLGYITNYISSILYAILRMAEYRLRFGSELYPIEISQILDEFGNPVYADGCLVEGQPKIQEFILEPAPVKSVKLSFLSSLRIKRGGRQLTSFSWNAFYYPLYRRIDYLNKVYNNNQIKLPRLWDDVPEVMANMKWRDMPGYFPVHEKNVSLNGLMGDVTMHNLPPEVLTILRLGELVHAGKLCSFGMGKYSIHVEEGDKN